MDFKAETQQLANLVSVMIEKQEKYFSSPENYNRRHLSTATQNVENFIRTLYAKGIKPITGNSKPQQGRLT
jgi:hypothetical protein